MSQRKVNWDDYDNPPRDQNIELQILLKGLWQAVSGLIRGAWQIALAMGVVLVAVLPVAIVLWAIGVR